MCDYIHTCQHVVTYVLQFKKGTELESSSSYRSLCLRNTRRRLYKAIIKTRLVNEIDSHKRFSAVIEKVETVVRSCQEKWFALIILDVRNSFNLANLNLIV